MQTATLATKSSGNRVPDSDSRSATASTQPPALLACILIPADRAEQFVSMLQQLVAHSAGEPPEISHSPQSFSISAWLNHVEATTVTVA